MIFVLDSSVALKWVLPEPDADKARRLRDDFRTAVHGLIAPDVFPVEVGHPLSKYERRGLLTDADLLWNDVMTTCPDLLPYVPLMPRALQLARQARIAVYDCLYVALAEREGCEVLTADDRLVRSLPASPIVLLASMR
jgi:predicted nucleic acid-binding protein